MTLEFLSAGIEKKNMRGAFLSKTASSPEMRCVWRMSVRIGNHHWPKTKTARVSEPLERAGVPKGTLSTFSGVADA